MLVLVRFNTVRGGVLLHPRSTKGALITRPITYVKGALQLLMNRYSMGKELHLLRMQYREGEFYLTLG